MELSPKQQINELIKTSRSILLVSHTTLDGDALGAILALDRVLTKMGKEVSLVSSEEIDENFKFLPGIAKIKKDISGTRDFVLKFDTEKTPIEKISYNREEQFINVVVSPKAGKLTQNEIEFVQGNFKFDLVFVLDTADVEKIDPVYDRQTELFFETTIINIDHHAGNEYFGAVNLVDLTATSTCEILVSIIESFGAGNFDEDVATCLLTGITADTGGFKNTNTTPKALTISAQMLAAGARQQEIIQGLYENKTLGTLKVWGKILSKLEANKDLGLAVATLSNNDLTNIPVQIADIRSILDEFLLHIPGADLALILLETGERQISGILKSYNGLDVLALMQPYNGLGNSKVVEFSVSNLTLRDILNNIMVKIAEAKGKPYANPIPKKEATIDVDKPLPGPMTEANEEKPSSNNTNEVLFEAPVREDPISKAIESIDQKIGENGVEAPSIDVEGSINKGEPMKPLAKILESHQPGTALEPDEEEIPYSPSEINGAGDKNDHIRTWKVDN